MPLRDQLRRSPLAVRLVAAAALLLALVLAVVFALAHVPPVRAYVLARVIRAIEADGRLVVRASSLRYNLFAGSASLDDVAVASRAATGQPFVRARHLSVVVPWRTLVGPVQLDAIALEGLQIAIVRFADGGTNLPASAPTAGEPAALPIGRLSVRDAAVSYRDAAADVELMLPGVRIELGPAGVASGPAQAGPYVGGSRGELALTRPGSFRAGARQTRVDALDARLSWDGRTLGLDPATLRLPEAILELRGSVGVLTSAPKVALAPRGTLNLAPLSPWLGVVPPIEGRVAFTGRMDGTLDAPITRLSIDSRGAAWRSLRDISARVLITANHNHIVLDRAAIEIAGGRVDASGQIDLHEAATPSIEAAATMNGIDLEPLAALADAGATLRPAARLDGRARVRGSLADLSKLDGALELIAREGPQRRGRLPLGGALRVTIAGGAWRADGHHRVAAAVVRVAADGTVGDTAIRTVDARLQVDAPSLADTARALSRAGVSAPAGLDGRGTALVTLRGAAEHPRVDAQVTVDALRFAQVAAVDVAARVNGTFDLLRVTDAQATTGANRVVLQGTIAPRRQRVDLVLTGNIPDPARLFAGLPDDVRPGGEVALDGRITGALTSPRIALTVDGTNLVAAGQRLDTIRVQGALAGSLVALDRIEATQGEGRLAGRGSFDLRRERFDVTLDAHRLALAPLPPRLAAQPIAGTIDAHVEGSGTVDDPVGRGTLTVRDLRSGGTRIGELSGTVALAGRHAVVDLLAPDWQARAQGRIGLRAPHALDLSAAFLETDLARALALVPGAPAAVRGTSTVTVRATGDADRPGRITAAVALERLDATVGAVPVSVRQPAHVRYANGSVQVDELLANVGSGTVRAAGVAGRAADPGVRVQLDARAEDLVGVAAAFGATPSNLSASGPLRLDALVRGTKEQVAISGTMGTTDARVRSGDLPEVRIQTLDATFDPARISVRSLSARWQEAALNGSASLPLALLSKWLPTVLQVAPAAVPARAGPSARNAAPRSEPAHLELRATNIGPEVVRPFVDAATASRLGGRVSVFAAFDADALALDRVRGAVQLDQLDVTVAELPIRQAAPTRIEIADGFARIAQWTWTGEGADLNVVGQVRLADRISALIATGSVDLRILTPFLADAGVSTAGRLAPKVVVSGRIDEPTIDGELSLTGGELVVRDPALAAADVTARAVLSRNRLDLVSLTGSLNGGTIEGRGALTLRDFAPVEGRLTMTGRNLALDVPRGLQSEADADVTLTWADEGLALGGTVRVLRGAYREPLALTAGLLAAAQAQPGAVGAAATPSLIDATRLNVLVTTEDDLHVDNNYGRFDLGGDLRLVGTVAQPALAGRIAMREGGQILFGGRTYVVDQPGTIDFSNPFRIVPDLNIAARTRVADYDITLRITGTPETITPELTSDPSLGQTDIVSLLLTGRTADQAGGVQAQVAGGQLLGYLSGEFLGVAGRALGLDRFALGGPPQATYRFDPGPVAAETDPASRLTFGKSIGRDLDVTLSQSLRQSGGLTWIVSYTPGRQLELRFVSSDDNSRAYEFRHDLTFGRPRVVLQAAPSARPAPPLAPSVASAEVTGAPPEDERALVDRLSLKAGRRFDFQQWQRDRDRLTAFYVDRGFNEARVRPRRTDTPGGVALAYAIDRGPKTTIVVEGWKLPDRLRDELLELWARGVFDTFRRDAMTRAIRAQLSRDGYLQPSVTVSFESASGGAEKVARIAVDPGPRVTARVVRIAGVPEADAASFEEWLGDMRLRDAAFDNPSTVESALIAHLREAGHLAAAVKVAPPVVEGNSGVVVIQIDPGAVYHVSALRIEGAGPGLAPVLAPPDGLQVGAVYTPAALAAGQVALETAARRAGYNDVKVGVDTAIDPKRADVSIAFRVEPGPRQILQDIVVAGAGTTRPSLVHRTLALPAGQPVSVESLFQARKRLAETGIFRRADVTLEPAAPAGSGDQPVRARVTVEEWPRYRLQYGFRGFDHEEFGPGSSRTLTPGLAADLTRRNLFGAGMTTGASLRAQAREREARAFWSAPTLMALPITSTFYVARGREEAAEDAGGFVTDDLQTTIEQRFRLPRQVRVLYSYNFARSHVFDPNATPGDPFAFDLRVRIARLNTSGLIDTRDNPEDTRRGWFHSSTLEYASSRLGSELQFMKYSLQQYYFRPVGRLVLASAARLGLAAGFAGQDLIVSERFFAGGGRTVRGYPEEGLGPRDFFGRAAGGDAMLVLNQEVRFPVYRWVRGVGFVDAGNVFKKIGDLSFGELKAGAGAGLRIATPVVLLRIDYGVPLGTVTPRQGRWVFSIGQTF